MTTHLYCYRSGSETPRRPWFAALFSLFALLSLAACGGGGGSKANPNWPVTGGSNNVPSVIDVGDVGVPGAPSTSSLKNGALVEFAASTGGNGPDEHFKVWVTDTGSIDALADAWIGNAPAVQHLSITIGTGSGVASHNTPWSWHVPSNYPLSINPLNDPGGPIFRIAPLWPQRIEDTIDSYANGGGGFIFCTMTSFDDRR